jgi:PAS domain-containing protein
VAELTASAIESAQIFESLSSAECELRGHWNDGSDLALVLEDSGVIQAVNPAACRALGYTAAEGSIICSRPNQPPDGESSSPPSAGERGSETRL